MSETFPHYSEDGYVPTNTWSSGFDIVFYSGLYRETNNMPHQWNRNMKRSKPVAIFTVSQWRTKCKENGKLWYGCDLIYCHSNN